MDEILRSPELAPHARAAPRWAVVAAVRAEVERIRERVLGAGAPGGPVLGPRANQPDLGRIVEDIRERMKPGLRTVINATGVVLHTNLGRAPLPGAALARLLEIGRGYTNLEYDLGRGTRGKREQHVSQLVSDLTGAEAGLVVNNCAAAVLLALGALAGGREVVVSRGELVEIGGAFRIPDVMGMSGARLCEVGTTNKTRGADYQAAFSANTALFLKVHRSNFAVVGFVEEVPVKELVALAAGRVPVMVDLGSGALVAPGALSTALAGGSEAAEPTVQDVVKAGADLITFSGDKLLGGPQAGLLCGKRALIEACASHPLYRALRPDKLTLGALEATLELYRDGRAITEVPALAMLGADEATLSLRADQLLAAAHAGGVTVPLEKVKVHSKVGGGSLPLAELDSWALAIGAPAEATAQALRAEDPAVIGRIEDDRLLLDVRTIAGEDVEAVVAALARLAAPAQTR